MKEQKIRIIKVKHIKDIDKNMKDLYEINNKVTDICNIINPDLGKQYEYKSKAMLQIVDAVNKLRNK